MKTPGENENGSGGAYIKISCLGDIMPADTVYTLGRGIGSTERKVCGMLARPVTRQLLDSDLVICNLESPLLEGWNSPGRPFAGNPEIVWLLSQLNVSVISLANNHILDHGEKGLQDTVKILSETGFGLIGLKTAGLSEIICIEKKGRKIAIAGFNDIHDNTDQELIAPLSWDIIGPTLDEIRKKQPDFILFSLHWGNEYITYPSPLQVDLAHRLIDEGVNVVIGHHPHVVQPVEHYKGGIILYSLGNYIFDMLWDEKVRSGIQADLLLYDNGSVSCRTIPYRISDDYVPEYSGPDGKRLADTVEPGIFASLLGGPRGDYEKKYKEELKVARRAARIKMKLHLLRSFFSLGTASRRLFLANSFNKITGVWKKS